jgi:TP901-1 family phage major tail protein
MTAQKGLSMLLKLGSDGSGGTVAGLQTTTLSINNEMVDVTTKDSAGWRALLQQAGVQSISISANGTAESAATFETLQGYAQVNSINAFQMVYGDGDTVGGNFQITKFEIAGTYNKEQTFTITLESSGQPTFRACSKRGVSCKTAA